MPMGFGSWDEMEQEFYGKKQEEEERKMIKKLSIAVEALRSLTHYKHTGVVISTAMKALKEIEKVNKE